MWQTIKILNEERAQILADMQAVLKKGQDEKRDLTDEESGKFDEMSAKAEAKLAEIQRYQKLYDLEQQGQETRQLPGREATNTPEQQADERTKEVRSQFNKFLRGASPMELRSLTIAGQGVVGDRPFYTQLVESIKTFAGVRQAGATILPTANGNELTVPTADDTANSASILGEATTNNDDLDPDLGNVTLKAYKYDSRWIRVSLEMLQDADYPLEQFIIGIAGERIGRAFNVHSTSGTGTGQPRGFLTGATTGKVAAATNAITYEELLDLIHSLDAGYRNAGAMLMLHDSTLAAIRKLKDGNGAYVFSPGEPGAPGTILGYRYTVNNDMPELDSGVDSKVVAFGLFSRYFVRDVTAVEVVRANELFIGSGLVGFRIFARHDGNLTDSAAVKTLDLAAA